MCIETMTGIIEQQRVFRKEKGEERRSDERNDIARASGELYFSATKGKKVVVAYAQAHKIHHFIFQISDMSKLSKEESAKRACSKNQRSCV